MGGAVITGAFVTSAVGAFYLLSQKHMEKVALPACRAAIADCVRHATFPKNGAMPRGVWWHSINPLRVMEALWRRNLGRR